MKTTGFLLSCIVAVLGVHAWGQRPARQYPRATVENILKALKRMDGVRVEVQGKATFGFETSVFRDASTCRSTGVRCTIWLSFANCTFVDDGGQPSRCSSVIEHMSSEPERGTTGPRPLVVDDVILRGQLRTVRRDLSYDKSVPPAARIGFGHLGAYPAELQVEQMEIQKVR